jgi:transposase
MEGGAAAPGGAVPQEREEQPVRCCGACTAALYAWAAWRRPGQMDTGVMESTGGYGMALCAGRDARGCDVKLGEAQQARQVPGRKTDVQDGQWLHALHTSGLLRGACRPEDESGVLRSALRQRSRLGAMSSRTVPPRQTALEPMHRKRTEGIRAIPGQTGMTMRRALLAGERAPQRLATSRAKRGQHDPATIAKALTGHGRAAPLLALPQAVDQEDLLAQPWRACAGPSEACRQTFGPAVEGDAPPSPPVRAWRSSRRHPRRFDVQTSLEAMTGVALPPSEGLASLPALKGIRELGRARPRWPTRQHGASWLGLWPGNPVSGGNRFRIRRTPSAHRAATAWRLAAPGVAHRHRALGASERRRRLRLGAPKAMTATAQKRARLVSSLGRYGPAYVDAGQQAYEQK